MCMVQPMGSTRSLTSLGTPMLSQASLLTGMVAAEDWVAKAVMAGGRCSGSSSGRPACRRPGRHIAEEDHRIEQAQIVDQHGPAVVTHDLWTIGGNQVGEVGAQADGSDEHDDAWD